MQIFTEVSTVELFLEFEIEQAIKMIIARNMHRIKASFFDLSSIFVNLNQCNLKWFFNNDNKYCSFFSTVLFSNVFLNLKSLISDLLLFITAIKAQLSCPQFELDSS